MLRSGHGHLPVKLLIFACLICGVLAECGTLKVFEGHIVHNTDAICVKRYKTNQCAKFVNTYDKNDLPSDYPKPATGVGKPQELSVAGIDYVVENKVFPGISLKWKSPLLSASRENCVGYLIVWHHRNSSTILCNLLLFNTSNDIIKRELSFQYDIRVVQQMALITVEVHSMPTLSMMQTDGFAVSFIMTPPIYSFADTRMDPSQWIPYITYSHFLNGTIVARFTLPPPKFNLTRFAVLLFKLEDMIHPLYDVDYRPPPYSPTNTHGIQFFNVAAPGCYFIIVQVMEEEGFRLAVGKCSCWSHFGNDIACEPSCGSTFIKLCMDMTTTDKTDPAVETGQSTATASPREQILNSNLAEAVTGGLISAILFLMFIFCIAFWLKHGSSVCPCCKKEPRNKPPKATNDNQNWSNSDQEKSPVLTNVVPLTEKTVYIIYSGDHQPHLQLVESFIAFLNVHCCCRVISLMQCDCDELEMYQWFLAKISTSDYIIFVDSKGAENLIVKYLNNTNYRAKQSSLEDDFFQKGIKYLMKSEEARENNLIIVSFEGKYCQKYLQVSTVYTLPKDMREFLQKLHNINERNTKDYDDWLPMHVENIPNLPEGARLLSAIKAVQDFVETKPDWLEKSFGPMKLLSEDAGYSSDVTSSTGLIATQDQTPSEFDSPVSVFEELDFATLCAGHPYDPTGLQALPHAQNCQDKKLNEENLYIISDKINTEKIGDMIPWYQLNQLPRKMGNTVNLETKSHDGESFISPETLSEIIFDTYSTALAQINTNGEFLSHYLQTQVNCDGSDNSVDSGLERVELNHLTELKLIPPETLSNVQEENMSTFFQDINASTENCINGI